MRHSVLSVLIAGLALLSCSRCGSEEDVLGPSPIEQTENFTAVLNGSNVVPPIGTSATGAATFRVESLRDGSGETFHISYSVHVRGITSITGVQIHAGARGQNGDLLSVVCGASGASCGSSNGSASGSIEPSHIRTGTFQELRNRMREGTAYVSILTSAHPAGEIRGQIQKLSLPCVGSSLSHCN